MIAEYLERRILLAAGELDLAFGDLGVVAHPDVSVETIVPLPAGGKLLAGGAGGSDGYALTRFNADGSFDTSFGGGDGRVVGLFTADGTDSAIEQITPLPDGKLLVSGYVRDSFFDEFSETFLTYYQYYVRRLLADGSADASFPPVQVPSNANTTTVVRSPQALPNGRAVVIAQGLLYGLTDSGTLDPDFGDTGNALAELIVNEMGRAIVGIHVTPEGKILASDGQTLARFNLDGTLDSSFGQNGLAVHDLGIEGEDGAMQVGDDGRVTVVTTRVSSQGDFPAAIEQHVVRFRADGSLDASFGDGGHVLVTFPTALTSRAPAFAPDGSVVLSVTDPYQATVNEERAWMRRVRSDGLLDEDFGLVLQRDFQFAAAVDGQGGLISAGQRSDDFGTELVLTRLAEDDPAAAATLTLSGGVASMHGTAADDRIEFRFTDSLIAVTRNTWGKAFALGTVHQFDADGGAGDDTIIAAANLLIPAHFDGGADRDRLGGGPARDTLIGGAQSDRIAGAGGADLIIGNGGNDVIQGGGGADHIYGGSGNDILLGNGGNDLLNAGAGSDFLHGGAGDDTFFTAGDDSADTIIAAAGRDTAAADAGVDELHGVEVLT